MTCFGSSPTAAFKENVLAIHNTNRKQYSARPLTWSDSLYPAAFQWATLCRFRRSRGTYGELLFASPGPSVTIRQGVESWMTEASKYNYYNP
ncbi:MAG: CAP domain-containing protein [Linnemannia gamsii]|nr:MAG: CAP domain-containing protein [Linnemannia gamsii]